jgi:hypothetical protein
MTAGRKERKIKHCKEFNMIIIYQNSIKKIINFLIWAMMLQSCSDTIVPGNSLSNDDLKFIQSIGLLDKDEKIELFYYTVSPKTTGNFITTKRVASYLEYEDNPNRHKDFAYFNQIDTLYSDFRDEFGFGNRIIVKKTDGNVFYLNVNGSKKVMTDFLEKAIQYWQESKK